jgi:hypothetical protein
MRILMDEWVHGKLKHELPGHVSRTVSDMNWKGIKTSDGTISCNMFRHCGSCWNHR